MPSPTYPGGGQQITVDALLKRPNIIARAIQDLTLDRFVADKIFAAGTPEQIAGGAAVYGRNESKYMDRDAEEVTPRSRYPRAGWTTALFTAIVHKYGLETPITWETRRRNAFDELGRAQQRLANSLVKFVDGVAMALLLSDPDVLGGGGSGDWGSTGDPITDIATTRAAIINLDEGYEPDTLILNPAQELDLILNEDIRNAMPRETNDSTLKTGRVIPVLGLSQVAVTNRMTAGTAVLLESGMAGTVADEQPLPSEGYQSFSPGGGAKNVFVKVYDEDGTDETAIRAARFPAMWLTDPHAARKITGI